MSALLALPVLLALSRSCAPEVAPETLLSVARAESGFDPLTIGVNGRPHRAFHPTSPQAAVGLASRLIAGGANVDLGLTQINGRNLARLGLDLRSVFDPCSNLRAGARVLVDGYQASGGAAPQVALQAALSRYNTGDPQRGHRNGYVAKVIQSGTARRARTKDCLLDEGAIFTEGQVSEAVSNLTIPLPTAS